MSDTRKDGLLIFECPQCNQMLEVGLHVVSTAIGHRGTSPITGTHYSHPVEFIASAPHLHAEFWAHMVRHHQPNPHPYMPPTGTPPRPTAAEGLIDVIVERLGDR